MLCSMTTEGKCEWCSKAFTADSRRASRKRFCSDKCRYAAWESDAADRLRTEVAALVKKYRKRGVLGTLDKEEKHT